MQPGEVIKMPKAKPGIFSNLNSERNGTSAEEVVSRLREMIQSGILLAGDWLPPERDLAKLLGVSCPTLRAGIRSLATVGILQSKQGAGTFVAEAEESPTLDSGALRLLSALHGFTSDEMFQARLALEMRDRKSTRLNSSHGYISYAVFCLKKKKKQ